MSDNEADKQLCRDYFDAFRRADAAWWEAHVSPDFVRHDPGLDFAVRGPDGMRRLAERMHGGMSGIDMDIRDMDLPIEDVVAENGKVLVRLRVVGTHGGELMGVAPTGRKIDIGVMDLFHVRDGVLVEHWALLDSLTMLKQLGVTAI